MSKPSGQPIDALNEKSSNITLSKTIQFAVCVDSSDPAYSGRIRAMLNKGDGVGDGKVNGDILYEGSSIFNKNSPNIDANGNFILNDYDKIKSRHLEKLADKILKDEERRDNLRSKPIKGNFLDEF